MLGINFKLSNMTIILRGGEVGPPNIADVFSIDLFTGAQTVVNGLDYTANTTLCWGKSRGATGSHQLYDTVRGATKELNSDTNAIESTDATGLTSFNSNGFTVGSSFPGTQVVWSFLAAVRFCDIVTYTGNSVQGRTIPHSLGIIPGLVTVKRLTDAAFSWAVQHKDIPATDHLALDTTAAAATLSTMWDDTAADATNVTIGNNGAVNGGGGEYVMYVFAHDLADDGVIQCGKYTGNGLSAGPSITLGWKPQYILIKRAIGGTSSWVIIDTARGILSPGLDKRVFPNSTAAEVTLDIVSLTATGFDITSTDASVNASGDTYIFMAIREE